MQYHVGDLGFEWEETPQPTLQEGYYASEERVTSCHLPPFQVLAIWVLQENGREWIKTLLW